MNEGTSPSMGLDFGSLGIKVFDPSPRFIHGSMVMLPEGACRMPNIFPCALLHRTELIVFREAMTTTPVDN